MNESLHHHDQINIPIGSLNCRAYDYVFGGFRWIFIIAKEIKNQHAGAFLQDDGSYLITRKPILEASHIIPSIAEMIRR